MNTKTYLLVKVVLIFALRWSFVSFILQELYVPLEEYQSRL